MATHSSVLAWRIPGTGEPVGCHLWGSTELDTTEVKQDLEKAEEPEIKLPTSVGSSKKQESFRETSTKTEIRPKPSLSLIPWWEGGQGKRGEAESQSHSFPSLTQGVGLSISHITQSPTVSHLHGGRKAHKPQVIGSG